jgi:hypothetical protein
VEHCGIFLDKTFYTETQEETKALGASTWKTEAREYQTKRKPRSGQWRNTGTSLP